MSRGDAIVLDDEQLWQMNVWTAGDRDKFQA